MEYFVGVLVSIVVEGIKRYFGTNTFGSLVAVAAVSFAAAGIYVFFQDTEIWSTFLLVLATAGSFHNFIIRRV